MGKKDQNTSAKPESLSEKEPGVKPQLGSIAKRSLSWIIWGVIVILVIWMALTIKNALDDTVTVEIDEEEAQELCDDDACIVFDGTFEDGFVEWDVREYWPFLGISVGTTQKFEEGESVDIVCPVEPKTDTFQHIWTKLSFLFKKNNIKSCDLVASEE